MQVRAAEHGGLEAPHEPRDVDGHVHGDAVEEYEPEVRGAPAHEEDVRGLGGIVAGERAHGLEEAGLADARAELERLQLELREVQAGGRRAHALERGQEVRRPGSHLERRERERKGLELQVHAHVAPLRYENDERELRVPGVRGREPRRARAHPRESVAAVLVGEGRASPARRDHLDERVRERLHAATKPPADRALERARRRTLRSSRLRLERSGEQDERDEPRSRRGAGHLSARAPRSEGGSRSVRSFGP